MPNTEADADILHVAVGVIANGQGELLIARRPDHLHQGGLWEFPGGKVEHGEDVRDALARELNEELGIQLRREGLSPLITVSHQYTERSVLLDVWWVMAFSGEARGREGQECRWIPWSALRDYQFPEANTAIVDAVERAIKRGEVRF